MSGGVNLARLPGEIWEEKEMASSEGTRTAMMLETCPETSKEKYQLMAERTAGGSFAAAIRLKCMECSGWAPSEVEQCGLVGCALHGFRSRHAKRRRRGAEEAAPGPG